MIPWFLLGAATALAAAGLTVAAFCTDDEYMRQVGAYFDAHYGPKITKKTSVPGPRGNAGDPARHGGMLPCPVAATPDVANSTHIEPPRAGGIHPVHLYAPLAIAGAATPYWQAAREGRVTEEVRAQCREAAIDGAAIPVWQAARDARQAAIAAAHELCSTDADRWLHLMRTWSFDTNTFPAIREEAAA